MEYQYIGMKELKEDIAEIKQTLTRLAEATTTLALHSQRLDNLESRITKIERTEDETWEVLRTIETRCALRERVYEYGLRKMETAPVSRDDWLNTLLGSALRNGLWIALTAAITGLITVYAGR